ncbi:mannosyl-N-acetyl-alpha-D-glucosaminyl-diphospho-ditrans,octacis-undecaprenol 3-alpha-mannosyltransferase / alpha-1,3-rhamnosyltransferase [Thermoflexales bacterium]|nr:mannosyl-N-acetyl-alpha-D-glucosaminyl-diphospho-ditrans,octacis-undecaprenol 3-alpha-mannosyltransferase / alpha-1,3-rhamnosyltransferase [Thermoflexales bacterium]
MRVGFDARLIRYPGVGRYIANALQGLAAQSQVDLVVYAPDTDSAARWQATAPAWTVRVVCARSPGVREQIIMPRLIAQDRIELFHAPHYVIPLLTTCRLAITLHDLVYLKFPASINGVMRLYYRFMIQQALQRAELILCDSQFTMREIDITGHKTKWIPIGISPDFTPAKAQDISDFRSKHQLPNYLLFVGTWKPWKNVKRLLEAFEQVLHSGYTGQLVLAGKAARHQIDLTEHLRRLAPRVTVLGAVSETDLPVLYSAADALVMPSLYEGFGLPVLEAMACGTPVVVAQAGPLPEVAGEAGIYFDPLDVRSMAQAILLVVQQPQRRSALIERGLQQARLFSIARMGQSLREAYQAVHEEFAVP